ncbi:MAG: hypothetical protein IH624_15720, partial [Phycisphaerae bacterium]|nr:hypothetical protein [Phycisphaerae bacterium]
MPNGDFNWKKNEYPQLEVFFNKISQGIIGFADRYNLRVQKYYHQFPSWDLLFRHPKGGIGKIEIQKETDNEVKLCLYWWV